MASRAAGALGEAGGAAGELSASDAAEMQKQLADLGMEMSMEELGASESAMAFKRQHMAAQQAKFSQAQAQKVHKEVVETAKNDPKKTVGLMRQWMDEA
jgi:flagellar biosynthesis/type III secretory pathway M-ring protein FliF/YscJ